MAVYSFEILKFILLILIAVVCAQNEPDFEYTCDRSGMHIKMTFDRPFRGLVYIKGYSNDPKCRLAFQVPVLEASFNILLMACDMVPHFPNPWISGIIVVQQHPLIPTINDTSVPVACAVEGISNATNWSEVSRKAQIFLNHYPTVVPSLEFVLAPGIFEGKTVPYPNNASITFRVNGAHRFNDMLVTECIAHDEAVIAHNTSIHQMTEPIGCSNTITETLSSFNVTKSGRGVITGAFAEFNLLSIPHPKKSFISCSAVLCNEKCQCPQNGNALGYQLSVTRKLLPRRYKRSTSDEMSARSNNGNYGIRNPLLRSTIKALTDRLMNNRRQPRIEKEDPDFEKRFMRNFAEMTTPKFPGTYNFNLDPTFPERVTASAELDTHTHFNIDSKQVGEKNVSSDNPSAMFIPVLEFEKFRTDLGEISTKSSLHHESTSIDPLSVTLIQEDDIEKMFHLFEQTTEDVLNPDTTLDSKDLQQKNLLNNKNEDFISTIDLTTETLGEMVNKTIVNERQEQNDCVPRLRFVIVTASLSFILVCLILGICGLVLYMSKEKKKRALDSFFLYTFN